MGRNDSYAQATVNQAYALIVSDEGQKSVAATTWILGANPALTSTNYEVAMYTRIGGNQHKKFKKNYNVQCDFYKMKRHSKENSFKIVGYPPDFKPKRRENVGNNNATYNVNYSHTIIQSLHLTMDKIQIFFIIQVEEIWDNLQAHKVTLLASKRIQVSWETILSQRSSVINLCIYLTKALSQLQPLQPM